MYISPQADATPVGDNDITYAVLGRVFPEPYMCVGFVTWNEFQSGMKYLEKLFPDRIRINVIGKSAGGNDIFQIEVTNEKSPVPYNERRFLFFSGSIHGNERGGAEGQLRVIEDLAMSVDPEIIGLLNKTVLLFNFLNPDGWIAGDPTQGGALYTRGNANGADLNREWPVVGWINEQYSPLSEPESIAAYSNLTNRKSIGQKFYYGADIHGMLQSQYLVDIMMPAGEYTFREMYKQVECAKTIYDAIMENMSGEILSEISNITGIDVLPAMWGTCWDAIGYTDTGFLGDWISLHSGLNLTGLDFELIFSHTVPNNVWNAALEYVHITAVRIIVNNMFNLSDTNPEPWINLPGKVAYIQNPHRIVGVDSEGAIPYDVCPTDFMRDLGRYTTNEIVPIKVEDVISGAAKLNDFKSLVVINDPVSTDENYVTAIREYVSAGGNLILTDGAAKMLSLLGIISESDIEQFEVYAGYIDISDWNDLLVKDVRGTARQTYEPIPLGYSIQSDQCPVWAVKDETWISKGGKIVGTTAGTDKVTLGHIKFGNGTIYFIGAVLPNPTEDNYHPYGLSSYAPTYTGYQIMINSIGGNLTFNWTPPPPKHEAPPAKTSKGFIPGFETVILSVALVAATGAKYKKNKRRRE